MQTLKDNIIEILIKSKHLTLEQLENMLKIQREKQIPLRKVFVAQGIVSEEKLISLLS